jgi:nitrogen fixation protein NifQ
MSVAGSYRLLMSGGSSGVCEQFDAHVIACVLSRALDEATEGTTLCDALGLAARELEELVLSVFPHAGAQLAGVDPADQPTFADDEQRLQSLLAESATLRSKLQQRLGHIVARRALGANELWQDLGLRNQRELSWLMARHFEPLAARNVLETEWKSFLFRSIERPATREEKP